ncbi:unnamed protein product [Paramecium primaurelia]|uniref:Uncharacterized protein n=1 Tax=Paramecium primaurelia TaxID=5886 RepID=A0A8S1QNI4_PARPR|nr:unnamed protein product [Paramecium primaurelia]
MIQFLLILLKLNSDIEFQQVQDRQILTILQLKQIRHSKLNNIIDNPNRDSESCQQDI